MKKETLTTAFEEKLPAYDRLGINLKNVLIQFLNDNKIDFYDIDFRIKSLDSFLSKAERKGYKDPITDTTDICGVRVIIYYPSDLELITKLINDEFNVIESSNKQNEMDDDRFGYMSSHYIATIKEEWLTAPNYRELGGLKFEIQARTILMHGWAAISHKLAYKHETDVPKRFRRDLFRLSALIELADEQFERLRNERKEYSESFLKTDHAGKEQFIPQEELNADSLQALLDFYFPERAKSSDISVLVSELNELDLDLAEFNSSVKLVLPYLQSIEDEESTCFMEGVTWAQEGAARTVLDLTNDKYYLRHERTSAPDEYIQILDNWRVKLNFSS